MKNDKRIFRVDKVIRINDVLDIVENFYGLGKKEEGGYIESKYLEQEEIIELLNEYRKLEEENKFEEVNKIEKTRKDLKILFEKINDLCIKMQKINDELDKLEMRIIYNKRQNINT